MAYDTVVTVFREDPSGQISLDIVKLITQTIKARNYVVHPKVNIIDILISVDDEKVSTPHCL
jgi:hypothetical protein